MNRILNKEPIPKFATEAEEAQWWYEQRDRLSEKAEAALARGELKPRRLSPSSVTRASNTTIESPDRTDVLELSYVDMGTRQVPPPEAQLWRFMDLAKFVSMLNHNALYFSVLAALKDELEGALPRLPPNATVLEREYPWKVWRYNRAAIFVNCWHQSDHEDAAMWALYGNQGVAIRTTFALLSQAVHQRPWVGPPITDQTVVGGLVTYADPDETSPAGDSWDSVNEALRKRWWYKYEQEFRLIYHLQSNSVPSGSSFQGPTPKQQGVWVSCDLSKAILAIVLAPFSPPFLEDAVKAVSRKFGLDPPIVKRSRIEEGAPTPPVSTLLPT